MRTFSPGMASGSGRGVCVQRLKGRTALVTGAARGIGRTIALRLAREGARLALASRDETGLFETSGAIAAAGGVSLSIPGDITVAASVDGLVEKVLAEWGRIDVLINNAGSIGPTKLIEDISLAEWEECLAVNLTGAFLMTKAVLPAMKRSRFGRIVSLGSVTGKRPLSYRTPYAAAKMGLIGMTRTLAFEVGPYGITANVICPGPTEGPRVRRVCENMAAAENITVEEAAASFTAPSALRRFVLPEDHASLCAFLCSEEGGSITGQDFNVSGGLVWY